MKLFYRHRMFLRNFVALLLLTVSRTSSQAPCAWGDTTGGPNYITDASHRSFLVVDEIAACAGKISDWMFSYDNTAGVGCHSMVLQVYRPVYGGYQLVGENQFDPPQCPLTTAPGMYPYTVHRAFKIPVQTGDLIGWTDASSVTSGRRMLEFSTGLPGSNMIQTIRILDSACAGAHSVCDWDQYVAEVGRKYSLRAGIETGDDPFIDNLPATTLVEEHLPPGFAIYQVIGSNDRNYNDIVHANFSYSLTSSTFQIDSDTGIIHTLTELNFETTQTHSLGVSVSQGPYTTTKTLTVSVVDVNEPHTLNPLPDERLDAANTGNNTVIYTGISVVDPDALGQPAATSKTLHLVNTVPTADIFRIEPTTIGPGGTASLKCTRNLRDWQGPEVIELYISASDDFHTSGPEKMTITIYNLWQPPTLDNLPNAVTVSEGTGSGTVLYTVTSSGDPSRAGPLTYSINAVYPPQVAPPARDPFDIDQTTGVVTCTSTSSPVFDYMDVRTYEVEILVSDGRFSSNPENLTVDITWENQQPVFNPTTYSSSVPELSPVGTLLPDVLLQVTDRDIPLGDWLDYTLSGTGAHLFHASNITNTVFVTGELLCGPGQPTQVYNLVVTATDSFGEIDTATLTVTVTDINNHVPVFTEDYYEGSVIETAGSQTPVLDVTVIDNDAGENAEMSFWVLEEEARIYFEVPSCSPSPTIPCTRTLQMKQPISHTDYPNITFTLMVLDHGIPSLNSTTQVFVEVEDVNDHPPEFVQDYYNMESRSDLQESSEVATVEVYDPDTVINSNVSFLLLIPTKGFFIEEYTGIIRNKNKMQAYNTHIFYVYARDWGSPEFLSNPCVVRVDTYTAKHHLVDIHMEIPLTEFIQIKEEFLQKLNQHITPWYAQEEQKLLDPYRSILTIYALEEKPPESLDDLDHTKTFVHRNALLRRLRVNIPGKPQDWLRDEEFAEYQVYKVMPTYPVWLIDTIPGIITLTILCLLFLLLWIAIFWAIFRGCKKPKNQVVPVTQKEEYALQYGDYAHVHYTEDPKTGTKKGVLSTPLIPYLSTTKKTSKNKVKDGSVKDESIAPIQEEEPVSELPPVEGKIGTSAFPNKPLPPSGQTRVL